MNVFTAIPRALWDVIKLVAKEFAALAQTPWQFRRYTEACGAPPLPASVIAQLHQLEARDFSPQALADALAIFDGIHDAIKLYVDSLHTDETAQQRLDRALEIFIRLVFPVLIEVSRRHHRDVYLLITTIMMVDDRIADNVPAFAGERIYRVVVGGENAARDGQLLRLLVPMGLPFGLWLLLSKALDRHFPATDFDFAAGWESELPQHAYGVPDPPRSTPVWMAQRTTSIGWTAKAKRKLADYATPAVWDSASAVRQSVTIVPVPAHSDALAGAGGPGFWTEYDFVLTGDKDLSRVIGPGWTLRGRGTFDSGALFPLSADGLGGDVAAGAGAEIELAWAAPAPPATTAPGPDDGDHGGASVALGGASFIAFGGGGVSVGAGGLGDFGAAVRLSRLQLAITPKSKVLGALVRTSMSTSLDLGLLWSNKLGLVIEGGSGLDLYLAVRRSIGSGWLGAALSYIRLSALVDRKPEGTKLSFAATIGLELSFLKATLILDGLGAGVTAESRKPGGNLLGLGHVAGDLIAPTGLGLKFDWGPIQGGGFLGYDAAKDRYAGAVELSGLGPLTLRGVGFTEPRALPTVPGPFQGPQASDSTTLVLLAFEQTIPSPGFSFSGIAVLIGFKRTASADAMRDALPSGALEALMFPSDPLGNTSAVVSSLATMFPPAPLSPDGADHHVAGVLVKLTFAGGFATAKIGFLLAWGTGRDNETKILVPFSLVVGKPSTARVFWLEVLGLGEYDAASHDVEIHAVLRNSRVCGGDLVGGLVVFRGDPDPNDADSSRGVFVSIGGYHPGYYAGKGPPRARVDNRLGVVLAHGETVKLEVSIYLAFVPGGVHLGIFGHLRVSLAGFGVDGKLWFDGVTDWSFENFTFDLGGSVALILFSRTVTELRLEGELSGQHPWHASGSVSFKLLWWSVSKSFSTDLSDATSTVVSADDVRAELTAALADPTCFPSNTPALVSLTRVPRNGIWNAPEQPFVFLQKVVPLDTQIDRVGRTPLAAPRTFHIDAAQVGSATAKRSVTSEFPPAAYLSLDTDAAIRAPAGEQWPAGFSAGDDAVAIGDVQPADAVLDEVTVDRKQVVPPPPRRHGFGAVRDAWAAAATVAAPAPIRVAPVRFASHATDAATSFADAWRRRGTVLRRTEGL